MKITVIHGQMHKGSTYHISERFVQVLAKDIADTKVYEFFLPKDGPDSCLGCFSCILKGEENCPGSEKVLKIVRAMEESEVIIVDSPTYGLEMSGQLKMLFDHLCFMWLTHRPNELMFQKAVVAISTTAGAGCKGVVKSICRQFFYMGVSYTYKLGIAVNAMSWDGISEKKKKKIDKKILKVSRKVKHSFGKKPNIKEKIMFLMMRGMQKANTWGIRDREYWTKKGWLSKERPW